MKKGVIIFYILIFVLMIYGVHNTHANTLIERTISGYKAKIIEYRTDSKLYDIKIGIHPKDGGTLRSIMGGIGGVSGVNGVFECPKDYAECGGKNYTINERYVNGEKKYTYKSTGDRVVFGWDKDIKPFLFQTDNINKNKEGEIWEGFANHPLLLHEGIPQTEIYHAKGLIDYKMKSKATKNFICSNKEGNKIFFGLVYSIDIDSLALVLKDFGCYNAINLDAGASTSFIYNGKYIVNPQREILDGVFIVPKSVNTSKLDLSAKKIMSVLLKKMSSKSSAQRMKELQKLNTVLNSFSKKIYSQNTSKIYKESVTYKNKLILEGIENNEAAQKLIQTDAFKKSENLFIKNNNIYKKVAGATEKKYVGTKVEINSTKTLEKIYTINLLRTYTAEIIKVYKEIDRLKYIKKLDLNLDIQVGL